MALLKKSGTVVPDADNRSARRDMTGLLAQLADARSSVRRWAARDLAEFPEAVAPLCAHLGLEADSAVRDAIFGTLARIGGGDVVDGVVPFLRSDDAELRNSAIEVLKSLPEATGSRIDALLKDPDPDVRIFALNVLEALRHPGVERWLVTVLMNDTHENVCATAIDLLGEVGTPAAAPALRIVRERFTSEFNRFACDVALRRIGA